MTKIMKFTNNYSVKFGDLDFEGNFIDSFFIRPPDLPGIPQFRLTDDRIIIRKEDIEEKILKVLSGPMNRFGRTNAMFAIPPQSDRITESASHYINEIRISGKNFIADIVCFDSFMGRILDSYLSKSVYKMYNFIGFAKPVIFKFNQDDHEKIHRINAYIW